MRLTLSKYLLAAMLTGVAFAQATMSCTHITPSTTMCEFSDGRANVQTVIGDSYTSNDYTADEWTKAKPGFVAAQQAVIAELQAHSHALRVQAAGSEEAAACQEKGGEWGYFHKMHKYCKLPKGGR